MRKYLFNFIIIIGIVVSALIYVGSLSNQESAMDKTDVSKANVALKNNLNMERGWALGTYDHDGNKLPSGQNIRINDNYAWTLPIKEVYIDGKTHELVVVITDDSMATMNKNSLADTIGMEQNSAYELLTEGSLHQDYKPSDTIITDLGGIADAEASSGNNYQPKVRAITESGKLIGKSSVTNRITTDDIK